MHLRKIILFIILLLSLHLLISAETKTNPVNKDSIPQEYRKRLLGDKAFNSGLYDVAINYYTTYLKNAEGNSPAIRDAYYCLIATCLRSQNQTEAEKFYTEVKTKFENYFKTNKTSQLELDYWHGEILLSGSKYQEASTIFEDIIKYSKDDQIDLKTEALIGLSTGYIRQEKWSKAKQVLLKLKTIIKSNKTQSMINQQLILINISTGNLGEVKKLLYSSAANKQQKAVNLYLLNILTLIKEKELIKAQDKYTKLTQLNEVIPSQLKFLVASALANAYIDKKEYKKALPLLDDASTIAPEFYYKEQIIIIQINCLIGADMYDKAENTATFFLKNFPASQMKNRVLRCLLHILDSKKEYQRILDVSKKYFKLTKPADSEKLAVALLIGQANLKLDKYDNALVYFNFIADNGSTAYLKGEGNYWIAETAHLQQKYQQALELFKKTAKNYPEWKENALFKTAQIYMTQKNYHKAIEVFSIFLQEYPNSKLTPSPLFLFAMALKNADKSRKAITILIQFAEKEPNSTNASTAYLEAGNLAIGLSEYKEAITYYKQILENKADIQLMPVALYKLINANFLAGNSDESVKYTHILLKDYPDSVFTKHALFWVSNYYTTMDEYKKSIETLNIIESKYSKNPAISATVLYEKASVLSLSDNKSAALTLLMKVEKDHPESTEIQKSYFLTGDVLSSEGKYKEAATNYLKASTYNTSPEITTAAYGRVGDSYFSMLNYTKNKKEVLSNAIKYYHKVLSTVDISILFKIQTLYKVGKCYELLGNDKQATVMYYEAVYGSLLDMKQGEKPSREWFIKSGIALTRLLQKKNTPMAAEAAISVYKTMIKYKIQPVNDFKEEIKLISKEYNLKG